MSKQLFKISTQVACDTDRGSGNLTYGNSVNDNNLHNPDNSCNLCIECQAECSNCNTCPDLFRICDFCLSCKYYDCDHYDAAKQVCQRANLSVLHINIRSLMLHLDEVEQLLTECVHPDILALSETWLNDNSKLKQIQLDGYKFVGKNSPTEYAGGTGMYISKNLKFKDRSDLEFDFEGCETKFVEIIANTSSSANHKNIILGSIYRHPHNTHDQFFNHLGKA